MSLEFVIIVCVSNALWAAICFLLVIHGERERDKLTQKILSKNLTEYANAYKSLQTQPITEEEKSKPFAPEQQGLVPLSEVEKDPFLLELFSNSVMKNLNKF